MKTEQQYVRAFAKAIHPIFAMKGWTYFNDDEPPSLERLEDTATHLINVCRGSDVSRVSTGRIVASRDFRDRNGQVELSLEFASYYGDVD